MRVISPCGSVTCPYCFAQFHLSKAARRSLSPSAVKEPDEVLGRFLSIPAPRLAHVELPPPAKFWGRVKRRLIANHDGMSDWKKICPECHLPLPPKTANGELSNDIFAIIGARSAGKSNYFGVLLKLLQGHYAQEMDFSCYEQETFSVKDLKPIGSSQLYRQRYGRKLFDGNERMAVDQTRSAETEVDSRIPLIYRLECNRRWFHYISRPLSHVAATNLVIFDAAGEDMDDPTKLEHYYRYLLRAKGIIFLIDPLQYPGLRSQLPEEIRKRLPRIETEPAEIVAKVITMFESRAGLPAGGKINVPVAFVLTKSDMLRGIVHSTSEILRDCSHKGGFNRSSCQRVGEEVVECIREWDCPQLVDLAQRRFRHASFFAVSALGELPDEKMRIKAVSPLRVGDPLLWILWKSGYIPAQRI
ncbi:MAG: hypothetical protein WCJ35_07310 [Planctomycetota bacterium]